MPTFSLDVAARVRLEECGDFALDIVLLYPIHQSVLLLVDALILCAIVIACVPFIPYWPNGRC